MFNLHRILRPTVFNLTTKDVEHDNRSSISPEYRYQRWLVSNVQESNIYTVEKVPLTFFVNTRDKLNFKKPKLFNLTKMLNVIIIGFATMQASTASSFKV